MPTFAAWAYKNAVGHPVNYPDNKLDYCSRFLKMMFALPGQDYEVDPVVSHALDKLFILHADHEQNCSTSAVRMVGSAKVKHLCIHIRGNKLHCGGRCTVGQTRP
jgi:citrate synthase